MRVNRRDKEFIERVRESRKQCMKPAIPEEREKKQLDWLLPPAYNDYDLSWTIEDSKFRMNTKDKNLWITGTKEQCEKFIKDAIGDDKTIVYNKKKFYWNNYFGQPFIVFRIYNKNQYYKKLHTLKQIGDWSGCTIEKQKSSHKLGSNLYHCIVLSTYTIKEFCKGVLHYEYENDIGSLEWRFDVLDLRELEMQKIEL